MESPETPSTLKLITFISLNALPSVPCEPPDSLGAKTRLRSSDGLVARFLQLLEVHVRRSKLTRQVRRRNDQVRLLRKTRHDLLLEDHRPLKPSKTITAIGVKGFQGLHQPHHLGN